VQGRIGGKGFRTCCEKGTGQAVLWIRNVFFSDPYTYPDPTLQLVSDPDPDPV
jgi:hypothetical protein